MPRTLNPATYSIRRDAFLDAAERLMVTRGWEQVTLQDILDETGASKGAFYHYFDSREALAQAVVTRMTDAAMAFIDPIVTDPALPAAAKLQAVFSTAGRWKTERSDLLLAFMRSWYSDDNDLLRLRAAREGTARLRPAIAAILRQGVAEGAFTPSSPDDAAAMLMALFYGSSDTLAELLFASREGRVAYDKVLRFMAAYDEAIERILGLRPGSITLVDDTSLHVWFDRPVASGPLIIEERP